MNTANTSPQKQRYNPFAIFITLIIIVLIAVGIYFLTHHDKSETSSAKIRGLYAFSYSMLDSYSLPGKSRGEGLTFKKPTQLVSLQIKSQTPLFANQFFQYMDKSGQHVLIAQLMVLSSEAKSSDSYIKFLSKEANNPKSSTANGFKSQIKDFLSQRLTKYKVNVGTIKPLNTQNLNNNAWIAFFTASSVEPTNLPRLQGEGLIAIGKNAYYYLGLDTVDYNWTPNQSVWDKVFNSIKIDQ